MFSRLSFFTVFCTLMLALGPVASAQAASLPQVKFETSAGDFVVELDPAKAPETVKNFLFYVKSGHYNGTIFHRIINGFMIQGGGFDQQMNQKPTRKPITNEAANGLDNLPYTIAMARTNDPHSATSQFFINVANNASLNYRSSTPSGFGYAVFGKVIKGMEVIDAIKAVPTGQRGMQKDVPLTPVVIKAVVPVQ